MTNDVMPSWTLDTETELSTWQDRPGTSGVLALTILCHPEGERIGERAVLGSGEKTVVMSRSDLEFFSVAKPAQGRPLATPRLSRSPIRWTLRTDGTVFLDARETPTKIVADGRIVIEEMEFSPAQLQNGVVLLFGNRVTLLLHRVRENTIPLRTATDFGLVGESDRMRSLRREIEKVAPLDLPVLLRGETGTGKELVSRAIHLASRRRERSYLAINMAAIPPALAAAELFGATRGAYTGSNQARDGYFQRADTGTLLLDEIGVTPIEVQPMLLRVLENQEVQRVGAKDVQKIDVRIIAATDSHLEKNIAAGDFRAPLLHRLSGYEIHLPPLRDRRDDIARLLYFFLEQELDPLNKRHLLYPDPQDHPWLPARLVAFLAAFPWPGNVRQLRNVARQLVIRGHHSTTIHLGSWFERLMKAPVKSPSDPSTAEDS